MTVVQAETTTRRQAGQVCWSLDRLLKTSK